MKSKVTPRQAAEAVDCQGIMGGMNTAKRITNHDGLTENNLHGIYREAMRVLNDLRDRVLEGLNLDEALHFANFIEWSRLCELLKPFDRDGLLTVDSHALLARAKEVQHLVRDTYVKQGKEEWFPRHDESQLQGINRRLDILAAQVSTLTDLMLSPVAAELLRSNTPADTTEAVVARPPSRDDCPAALHESSSLGAN